MLADIEKEEAFLAQNVEKSYEVEESNDTEDVDAKENMPESKKEAGQSNDLQTDHCEDTSEITLKSGQCLNSNKYLYNTEIYFQVILMALLKFVEEGIVAEIFQADIIERKVYEQLLQLDHKYQVREEQMKKVMYFDFIIKQVSNFCNKL